MAFSTNQNASMGSVDLSGNFSRGSSRSCCEMAVHFSPFILKISQQKTREAKRSMKVSDASAKDTVMEVGVKNKEQKEVDTTEKTSLRYPTTLLVSYLVWHG